MNRRKKIVTGVIACAFVVLILMLAVVLIAPKVVDTATVRDKVRSKINETSGAEIDFKHLVLDFFPHPRVIFDQVTLSLPPGVRGTVVSVSVRPKILPLFLGKLQIAVLRLDSAELDYTFPKKPATAKTAPQPFSFDDLVKRIQSVAATLPEFKIPDLDFRIKNSKANLFDDGRKLLELTEVNSQLAGPPAGRKITLNCQSNLWQSISIDLALTQSTPPLSLQVKGTRIDVAATRQVALALSGKNDVVKNIFDIVKGGSVPLITLKVQGNSLSDLGTMNNMVIRGQMRDGEIYIPEAGLDLKDVTGEVVISRGILQGQNLRARLGNSFGQNGKLKLGLIGDVAPFHLEVDVRADLSQLPPILKRLVDDKNFQKELALVKGLKGSATGKLVLGEDTENVKVTVEASNIHLNADYGRLPYPLQISGGNFSYDEKRIGVRQLSGKLGKSSFSELSGSLGLGKNQDLAIRSGKSRLFLAEIVPWLASFDKMRQLSKYYGGGKSVVTLAAINLKGPLLRPPKWSFNVSGNIEDLVLKNMPLRPGPMTISSAKFKADPQSFNYTDGRISMLDGVWKISGRHKRYFKGVDKDISITFEGQLGSKSVQWLSKVLNLPPQIQIRPLTLSKSHLSYVRNGEETLSASLAIKGGLKISTDLVLGSEKPGVKKIFIQDNTSRATIAISHHNKIMTFSFKGNLHRSTLDKLMTQNPWLAGWLEGDFKAHINMENPLKSAAWGKLKGQEISYPWKPDTPVTINDFAVTATTDKINLTSADLTFGGNRLQAAGNMTRSARNVLVDMDITADTVDLDPLIQALKDSGENGGGEKPSKFQSIPVQGNIRFKADRFKIGRFIWNPLLADISLNNGTADVALKKALLCGISTPGTLKVSPPNVEFDLQAVAKDQELNPAQTCLVGGTFKADGTYSLKGRFQGRGKAADLLKMVTGQVEFRAQDGHIYRDVILRKSIEYLNTREAKEDRVNVTDMGKKGFGYHSLRVKAKLQDGKLRYEEAVLHGRSMTVTAAGEHDLQNGQFDLTLLVAPLVTLNRIFEDIPLIGHILEALDTIPLSVKGTLDNIHVYPLAPSAVGYELKEMMKNTVERPINLIQDGNRSD